MALKLTNNATARLAASLTTSETSVVLRPGDGSMFPTLSAGDWFPLTVLRPDNTCEIMYATARSGDVLTVTRAQENTPALTFFANDRAELRATAGVFGSYLSLLGGTIQGALTVTGGVAVGQNMTVAGTLNAAGTLSQGGNAVWHTGNLNPASYLPLTGGTLSGNLDIANVSPVIHMTNAGYGAPRAVHAAPSGEIGFLSSSNAWTAYSKDDGTFVATGDIAAYSDRKHKRDIFTIRDALTMVERMRGVRYVRRDTGKASVGVIAQEVRDVVPEIVGEGDDGLYVDYGKIGALLIEAVKDLACRVRKLEARP